MPQIFVAFSEKLNFITFCSFFQCKSFKNCNKNVFLWQRLYFPQSIHQKKVFLKYVVILPAHYQTQPSWYCGWPNTLHWGQSSMLKGTFQRVDLSRDERYICPLFKYIYIFGLITVGIISDHFLSRCPMLPVSFQRHDWALSPCKCLYL